MKQTINVASATETEAVGYDLAKSLDEAKAKRAFIALFGEMGVGKTAFCRGFARYFGISNVKSPTYTVLNEYRGSSKIHHFDFYRITDGDDLYSIGYDDIIESDGFSLGEWSENIVDYLPPDAIKVTISRLCIDGDNTNLRKIEIER